MSLFLSFVIPMFCVCEKLAQINVKTVDSLYNLKYNI